MKKETNKKSKLWIWLAVGIVAVLAVIGVILALLLPGGQSGPDSTGGKAELYWNVDRLVYMENAKVEGFSERTAAEDGNYYITFAYEGQQVQLQIIDKQLVNIIDNMDLMGLVFDADGVVIDAVDPTTIATETAKGAFVQKVEDDCITVNTSQAMNGMTIELPITENTGIYDVTPTAELVGQIGEPQIMDQILAYADESGEITHIYITAHPVDAGIYWRVKQMYDSKNTSTTRQPDENGVYTIQFAHNGKLVDVKCKDKEIVSNIDSKALLQGQFACLFDEEGYLIECVNVALALRGTYLATDYHVTAIEGDTYTLTKLSSGNEQGRSMSITLAENCEIFNCCQWECFEHNCGEYTDHLNLYDRVNVYANLDGEAIMIFVTRRMIHDENLDLYFNYNRQYGGDATGTMRKPVNGYYVFEMLLDGKLKTVRVKDKEMADAIDKPYNKSLGLVVEGDIVTKVYNPSCVVGGANYANEIPVTMLSGPMVTFSYTNGTTRNFVMSGDCKVYNAITGEYGKNVGGEMTLQQGDVVVAFTDYKDELALVYVVSRPVEGAKVYYNLSRRYDSETGQTTREPNADGYYEFQFACEGKQVTAKTKSKGMATFIDSQSAPIVGLKINSSGIITNAYIAVAAVPNSAKVCNYHYVKDLNNKEKTFGTYYIIDDVRTDSTAVQKIADNCAIYNVSTSFENFRGEKATLKNGDQIQGIKDLETGEVIMIFIMRRDPTYGFESYKAKCSHCGKTVTWQPYGGTIAQADGHYYACGNFTLNQGSAGVKDDGKIFDIVLDLKGHSITSTGRAFLVYDKLTILDTVGGGKVAGTTPSGDTATIGSTIMVMEGGELNLMGGNLTLSEKSTKFGTLGGVVYVQPKATMNMSGGSITGGTSDNGGNVYVGGTFNLSGGTISGGTAPLGQNISLASTGTLNISGGTVDGGIYMGNGAVTLSGKPVIGGTGLAVTAGKQISVKGLTGGASVVITGNGIFTEELSNPENYLAYFKAAAEGDSISVKGAALSYYKKPADYNSVDNSNLKFAAGTQNAYCPVCEKTVTWTALTAKKQTLETGHYYLASDLTYAGDKDANDFFLTAPGTGKTACLHLNGHNISCTNNRVIQGSTGVLNILGNGTVTGGWKTGSWVTGGTIGINTSGANGTINLIGGTYLATAANTPVLAITDNGGTISVYNGATVRGSGSGSVVHIGKATLVNANFNVYGGTVEGGAINMSGAQNDKGNTTTLTIAGGKVAGGVSVNGDSKVVLAGSPVVTGLSIPKGIIIDADGLTQGAAITVQANGVFTQKLANAEAVKAYFTPASSDDEILVQDGALVYAAKKPAGGLELDENGYAMCEHCGQSVQWTEVTGGLGTVTDTSVHHHYYLTGNMNLGSGALMSVNGKANVCLHLNGYTLTQKGWINVIQGTLSILNGTATTGGITGTHDTYNTFNVSWGTLNIYGGTYSYAGSGDKSAIQLGQTSSKLNLYGGKVADGIDVNKGTLTLSKTAIVTGAENELTDNIYVAAAGKLVVKSDYEGTASVKFENALTDNAVPVANGSSEGAFNGKLYLEAENTPELVGEGAKLVVKTEGSGEEDDGDGEEEEKPAGVLELDENGYAMCDHCGQSVQWTAVTGGLGTITDTSVHHHYYLIGDMTLTTGGLMLVNSKANVCLHLNGYTVTQKGWINVIQGSLSILNGTATTGGIIGNHDTYNTFNVSWGTLNIYGGTYTYAGSGELSTIQMGQTSSKLNLYGGKVIGGIDVNKGTLTLSKTATVTGAENELTDNIYVATAGKLVVKSDYTGTASVNFESIVNNTIPMVNGACDGIYTGKLYLEAEDTPEIIGLADGSLSYGAEDDPTVEASISNVVMTVGADETQRNFTWYTNKNQATSVQIALASNMTGDVFPNTYETVTATTARSANKAGYYTNKATVTCLEENTDYIYRLVIGEHYSQTYSFSIGTFEDDFQFAFVGDPQFSDATYSAAWSDTLQKIDSNFDAEIVISAGDQINTASSEEQYELLLVKELTSVGFAPTVGPNHDDPSVAFSEHFNLPNLSTQYGADETSADYWYTYNNVLFMHLNMADSAAVESEHKAFMQEAIAANPDADWKIVVLHTALFSTGYHSDPEYKWYDTEIAKFRSTLAPQLSELDIDVVLSGHDHVYVRSQLMNGTEVSDDVVTNNKVVAPDGTLHICANSSTGSKFYDCYVEDAEYVAAENYEKRKSAILFSVTDNELSLKSYFLDDMSVFDTFSIYKEAVEEEPTGVLELDENGYAMCDHCGQSVQWMAVTGGLGTITDTSVHHHYYLIGDMTLTTGGLMLVNSKANVCLHLNGYTVTQKGWINVIQGTLSILNGTATTGGIVGTHDTYNTINVSWGTLNIYGGTYSYAGSGDLSTIQMGQTSSKLNIYGGKVIGGIDVNKGTLTLSKTATVTGDENELTDNIYVATAGKLVVKSDYTGTASVAFESLTNNTIAETNGVSEGAFTGKLYLEAESKAQIFGEGTSLVIVPVVGYELELDENGYGMCQHCGNRVQWTAVTGALGTIEDNSKHHHYYLTGNMTFGFGFFNINGKADVCLHLNNHTVTQKGWINVISGTLSIMDGTAGTGGIIGNSGSSNTFNVSWGTLNIYAGTYQYTGAGEKSTIQMGQTSSKLNIYGGKVIGGIDVNKGTLTIGGNATIAGDEGELTDNIYVAAAGKLVVNADYTGKASVAFESFADNTVPAANGVSNGEFTGKLYLEIAGTPALTGKDGALVLSETA